MPAMTKADTRHELVRLEDFIDGFEVITLVGKSEGLLRAIGPFRRYRHAFRMPVRAAFVPDAPPGELYGRSLSAAREALEVFNGKPNKIGRARMFGDKSIGLYDPVQLALVRIIEGLNA
jgi:hypothetical protein